MNIQHVIDLLNRAELYDEVGVVLEMAEQNKELLEALKLLHRNFRSQHASLLILGAPDFTHMDKVAEQAITKAEATE